VITVTNVLHEGSPNFGPSVKMSLRNGPSKKCPLLSKCPLNKDTIMAPNVSCKDKFWCSYLWLGAYNKFVAFTINHYHWDLSQYKVSTRNSKMSFSNAPEWDHSSESFQHLKNTVSHQQEANAWTLLGLLSTLWAYPWVKYELKRTVSVGEVPSSDMTTNIKK
jgi:hypothetical protein